MQKRSPMRKNVFILLSLVVLGLGALSFANLPQGSAGLYQDGTYQGQAQGHNGPLVLEVTISSDKITAIEIVEHVETPFLSDLAFDQVPPAIIEQGTTEVELVTGASVTSKAIVEAVEDALRKAKVYRDGTYQGQAQGHNGPLVVEVTISANQITAIEIVEHSETPFLSDLAFDQVPPAIIEQGTTQVDHVTGASVTSKAIMEAVDNALLQAQ
ncbi:MAG: FMN-binding protein [Limnochordia bacterium]